MNLMYYFIEIIIYSNFVIICNTNKWIYTGCFPFLISQTTQNLGEMDTVPSCSAPTMFLGSRIGSIHSSSGEGTSTTVFQPCNSVIWRDRARFKVMEPNSFGCIRLRSNRLRGVSTGWCQLILSTLFSGILGYERREIGARSRLDDFLEHLPGFFRDIV